MNKIDFEAQLTSIASEMEYPRTPDIAGAVTARLHSSTRLRLISKARVWSLTILLILILSLILIPPARAAIIEIIQIGIVRIFSQSTAPTVQPITTATPESFAPQTATPSSSASSLIKLLDQLAGETTLVDAQGKVPYLIQAPTYPSELGNPDRVYVQDLNDGKMTVLIWFDSQDPAKVSLSLHFIPSGSWAINKMRPKVIQETQVKNQRAIWAEGPYPLILKNKDIEFTRLIEGHVLIWSEGDITYRLETNLRMEEAIKIAESLEPVR